MKRTIAVITITLSTCYSAFAQHPDAHSVRDIQTVTIVDNVWTAPGLRFARVHHPGQKDADADIIVCETRRKDDCQPLRVGKTYPAAMIDNGTSKAYPYRKQIEQVVGKQTCTSLMIRTLVIITDEVGDKIREFVPAVGDTTVPLYYAMLAKPDAPDNENCHPNKPLPMSRAEEGTRQWLNDRIKPGASSEQRKQVYNQLLRQVPSQSQGFIQNIIDQYEREKTSQ